MTHPSVMQRLSALCKEILFTYKRPIKSTEESFRLWKTYCQVSGVFLSTKPDLAFHIF